MANPQPATLSGDSVMDAKIGVLLRTGVLTSAAVVLLGGVLFLLHDGRSVPNYRMFQGVPPQLHTLRGIASGAFHGDGLAIIQFGLLLLIATPIARVVFAVILFLAERDYLYVAVSMIVLLVLVYSLIWH